MKNPFPFFPGTMWKDLKQNSILKQLASFSPRLTSPV